MTGLPRVGTQSIETPTSSEAPIDQLYTSLALLTLPIGAGLLLGYGMRRGGRRFEGVLPAILALCVPSAVALLLYPLKPIVGFWDVVFEGVFVGIGVLLASHSWFRGRREIALTAASVVVSLLLLEVGARLLLPPAPGFPTQSGPNLFLADALLANAQVQGWDIGSNEVVCSAVYGSQYARWLNQADDSLFALPSTYSPRPDATRHVLHLGDSMVYGLGVPRDQRFSALLERWDPGTEHINAGLPGTAPDSGLAMIRPWIDQHPIDLVVMYLYESNDYAGLDSPSPCCDFESILVYDQGRASLRCPVAQQLDLDHVGLAALRIISPPPYLLRVLVPYSRAAAEVAAALVARKVTAGLPPAAETNLDTIMQTAADDLRSRGIPLVAVMLPIASLIGAPPEMQRFGTRMMESARKAGVPVLDADVPLRAAVQQGIDPFLASHDGHFSGAGHDVIARWLAEQLPARQTGRANTPPSPSRP